MIVDVEVKVADERNWTDLEQKLRALLLKEDTLLLKSAYHTDLPIEVYLDNNTTNARLAYTRDVASYRFHMYCLKKTAAAPPPFPALPEDGDQMYSVTDLPSQEYRGICASLVFEDDEINELLDYIETTFLFRQYKLDTSLISFNRLILLHGVPGTGKPPLI